jgi:hypothetical protein
VASGKELTCQKSARVAAAAGDEDVFHACFVWW